VTRPSLTRIEHRVLQAEELLLVVLLALTVLATFAQIVLRNLPDNPSLPWIDLAARLTVLWIGLLGASIATARNKHITVDVVSRYLPPAVRSTAALLLGLFSMGILLALAHASLLFTLGNHEGSPQPLFVIPTFGLAVQEYFFTDPMPLVFLVMLFHQWAATRRELPAASLPLRLLDLSGLVVLGLVALIVKTDLGGTLDPAGTLAALDALASAFVRDYALWLCLLTVVLAMVGLPLFAVICLFSFIGHYGVEAISLSNMILNGYQGFRSSTVFLAIPLFTLAGYLMAEGSTPTRLVNLFRAGLGWMPGGMALAGIAACAFFTAFTGASGVTIIALGGLLYPMMKADRYGEDFTLGLLTTSGSRGLVFPPSTPVFLLAMIMGLSWEAVSRSGEFGGAVVGVGAKEKSCLAQVDNSRQAFVAELEQRTKEEQHIKEAMARYEEAQPGATAPAAAPRDEFEMGDDDSIDDPSAAPAAAAPKDEFEMGDDDSIDDPTAAPVAANPDTAAPTAPPKEEALAWMQPEDSMQVPGSSDIFAAALLPGLLMLLAVGLYAMRRASRTGVPRVPFSGRRLLTSLRAARWELPIPVLIGVGIFGGFFTPAEAASATAFYVLVMQTMLYREVKRPELVRSFVDSMVMVGGIFIILIAAQGLLNFLVSAKVPDQILFFMEELIPDRVSLFGVASLGKTTLFLIMLNLFLLVVGCMMDIFSAIMIVYPLILPMAYNFGVHPAHLAVVFLVNLEIGYSTPPVGLNLFVASLRFNQPVVRLYSASVPYLIIMLVSLLLITYVPELSLWLPGLTVPTPGGTP
jgi:TRAP-type C4-dicarboxylate transport system permease large subunit/TRAP-type C4-dicarboxylate transport system permease small subunit